MRFLVSSFTIGVSGENTLYGAFHQRKAPLRSCWLGHRNRESALRVAATRMRSDIPVHSALAHTCEMGGGLRGVVNDLL
jgi:hypothetical protein